MHNAQPRCCLSALHKVEVARRVSAASSGAVAFFVARKDQQKCRYHNRNGSTGRVGMRASSTASVGLRSTAAHSARYVERAMACYTGVEWWGGQRVRGSEMR